MSSVFEILLCLFAILGLYLVITTIFDFFAVKNAPSKSVILIEECDEDNLDYLIRVYQGRLLCPILDTIVIAPTVNASDKLIEKLNLEFGNVKKM